MSKHTPGPWSAPEPRSDYGGRFFDRSIMAASANGNPIPVARAYNNIGTDCAANARLIAAAPDLLAACEAALASEPCVCAEIADAEAGACLACVLFAAIAKAKGGADA